MICETCHSELLSEAAFCSRCGSSVQRLRTGVRFAGFWRRVLAVLIDLVLLAPAIELGKEFLYLTVFRQDQPGITEVRHRNLAEQQEADMTMLKQMAKLGTLIFFLSGPYYALTESSALRGTLGKRMLGMRVTDLNGRRIRLGRASLRYLARMLSATPWQLGFVMAAFTSKKQALHDMLVGTVVVLADKVSETEEQARSAGFLTHAGSLLKLTCPNCSKDLLRDSAFCSACGTPIPRRSALPRFASFGRRSLAIILDFIILIPVIVVLINLLPPFSQHDLQAMRALMSDQLTSVEREDVMLTVMMGFAYLFILVFSLSGTYCALTESSVLQGTLGKRLLGLRVTDLDGRRIRLGRAIGRHLTHILSAMLWLIGFIMAAFTPRRQALHDILMGTLVVVEDEKRTEGTPRQSSV